MANQQFPLDRSAAHPWAMQASNLRDLLNRFCVLGVEVFGKATACQKTADPAAPDWANLEAQFGLRAGDGPGFYALLQKICGPLVAPSVDVTLTQVQLASDIREFIDRVG